MNAKSWRSASRWGVALAVACAATEAPAAARGPRKRPARAAPSQATAQHASTTAGEGGPKQVAFIVVEAPGADLAVAARVENTVAVLAGDGETVRLLTGDDLAARIEGDPVAAALACGEGLGCLATLGAVAGCDELTLAEVQAGAVRFVVVSSVEAIMLATVELPVTSAEDVPGRVAAVFADVFGVPPAPGPAELEALPPPAESATRVRAGPGPLVWAGVGVLAAGAVAIAVGVAFGVDGQARFDAIDDAMIQVEAERRLAVAHDQYVLANASYVAAGALGLLGGSLILAGLLTGNAEDPPAVAVGATPDGGLSLWATAPW